jgi:mono/diheme cytochrome c family protein
MSRLLLAFLLGMACFAALADDSANLGERIYRHGLKSDRGAIVARVGAGGTAEGPAVACINCHGELAEGRPEAWASPPPIQWSRLSRPLGEIRRDGSLRPSYDERLFGRAVVSGIDPSGRKLSADMPKFPLRNAEIQSLIAYLKQLDGNRKQGTWQLGTFIAPNASPEARKSVDTLRHCLRSQSELYGHPLDLTVYETSADRSIAQLADQIRQTPEVLALVSPVITGSEQALLPILTDAGLPVIGPIGTFSPESGHAGSNFYFLFGGLGDEVAILAQHLGKAIGATEGHLWVVYDDVASGDLLGERAARAARMTNPAPTIKTMPIPRQAAGDMPLQARPKPTDAVLITAANSAPAREFLDSLPRETLVAMPWLLVAGISDQLTAKIDLVSFPWIAGRRGAASLYSEWSQVGCDLALEALRRAGASADRAKLDRAMQTIVNFAGDEFSPGLSFSQEPRIGVRGAFVTPLASGGVPAVNQRRWISLPESASISEPAPSAPRP